MPTLTVDYSTTDATFWRAVVNTDGGVKVASFEVRRAGSGITRREALIAFSVFVRSLRPALDRDAVMPLLRSIESEIVNG